MRDFKIAEQSIGLSHKPYIIAEMSGNHKQSLDKALQLVDAAAEAGADAVKLQTYTADTMTLNVDLPDFKIDDPNSLWHGRLLYDLYGEAHTPWEWHKAIMVRAKERGLACFSSPFDQSAVNFLEELNVPAYKIASFENTDINLIQAVAQTGKPVIVSTGMATLEDLDLMVNTLREAGCENFILLKCTSAYPASPADANIKTIPHLSDMFNCQVGLSDHTMGIGVPLAAVALGATIIEKHFCLSREEGGVDSAFSLEPHELKNLVTESKKAWECLGKVSYGPSSEQETKSKQFRRSIYFTKAMAPGERVTEACIRCIRPGYGLAPKFFNAILNRELKKGVAVGERVSWGDLVE